MSSDFNSYDDYIGGELARIDSDRQKFDIARAQYAEQSLASVAEAVIRVLELAGKIDSKAAMTAINSVRVIDSIAKVAFSIFSFLR